MSDAELYVTHREAVQRLNKDLRQTSRLLSHDEARFLVNNYYTMQDNRIRASNQMRRLTPKTTEDGAEPEAVQEPLPASNAVLGWLAEQSNVMEKQLASALNYYTDSHAVGRWSRKIIGIGPIIAAGLIAHIDITKAPTAGHIWRYAGLDPTVRWEKGMKCPWNDELKKLCWKLGESFVKVSGNKDSLYGRLYKERKAQEIERNEALAFSDQAAEKLRRFNIGKTTDAYKHYSTGKLPPAHIHARAKRFAVKIFLSHWHGYAYRDRYGEEPPKPFAIAHLSHAHMYTPEVHE